MDAAQLSVLLPVKNAAHTLDRALQSTLLDLPDQHAELIAVDDQSGDASRSMLERWSRQDPRIRIIDGAGAGLVAALNLGLAACRGELIARMDADDEWLPGRLRAQRAALEAGGPGLAAVGGRVEIRAASASISGGMARYQKWLDSVVTWDDVLRERFVESPLVHPATLIRKAWLRRVGGYRAGAFPEDYDLWLRLIAAGARLLNVEHRVLRWHDSAARLTRVDPRYRLQAHQALKAEHLGRLLGNQVVGICGAGPTGLAMARLLAPRGVRVGTFYDVHPRKIGQRIDGIPVRAYSAMALPPEGHTLVAVGRVGAREEIRGWLVRNGCRELHDFTCVA